jgi:hypothetical protein
MKEATSVPPRIIETFASLKISHIAHYPKKPNLKEQGLKNAADVGNLSLLFQLERTKTNF